MVEGEKKIDNTARAICTDKWEKISLLLLYLPRDDEGGDKIIMCVRNF